MTLPRPYDAWMEACLPELVPEEPRASCQSCPMVPVFDAASKCCTYYPDLPNFSVGRILADGQSPGHAEIRRRLAAGTGTSPLGITHPPGFEAAYARVLTSDRFGRAPEMRCPYHTDDGRCGIWAYRESTCATWHCKHERGAPGKHMWVELGRLLRRIEDELALWCAVQLGVGDEAVAMLGERKSADLCEVNEPRFWGPWEGRREELYLEAMRLVLALSPAEVLHIGGEAVDAHIRLVKLAFERLGASLPERLEGGDYKVLSPTRVVAYTETDPLDLPAEVVAALPASAGLDAATLRKLVDHEVLIPAKSLVRPRGA